MLPADSVAAYSSLFALSCLFFFFNDPATTEFYTLSLHDALPIYYRRFELFPKERFADVRLLRTARKPSHMNDWIERSEEHTSELQSHSDIVCRLLLEKTNNLESEALAVPPLQCPHNAHVSNPPS